MTPRVARTTGGIPLRELGEQPVISVVTVTRNVQRTLERTLQSVFSQTYPFVEYIVIDGESSDGTVDLIRAASQRLSYWHSLPDHGISDGFNLGIAAAAGRYVALVHADDWLDPGQAALAVDSLERTGAAFAFGRLAFHDSDGAKLYEMDGDPSYWRVIHRRMPAINHPTVVVRKSAYQSVGMFSLTRRVAMDYDWHLRAELAGLRGVYVADLVGHMTVGGTCFREWKRGLREVRDTAIEHGQAASSATAEYVWRLARGNARSLLTRMLPKPMTDFMHQRLNPNYRPAPADGQ